MDTPGIDIREFHETGHRLGDLVAPALDQNVGASSTGPAAVAMAVDAVGRGPGALPAKR